MSAPKVTYLFVTLTIDPKQLSSFLAALTECYLHVIAEPENLGFQVFYDEKTPGVFKFFEGWNQDIQWLAEVQLQRPYYKPYIEITEKQWIKPRELIFLNRHNGFGHVTLPTRSINNPETTFFLTTIHIAPSDLTTFLSILKETSYADATRKSECFVFEVLHNNDEPGVVKLVEGWTQSKEWYETVHMKSPHYAPYIEATEKLWTKPRELLCLNPKEGFGYVNEKIP